MLIAVTGATGFLGHYLVEHLVGLGYSCRCLHRPASDRSGLEALGDAVEWYCGELGSAQYVDGFVAGASAVVHAALDRPGKGFRGQEGDVVEFARQNILGTLRLIEAARSADVDKFVFVSTCAVHETILEDRPLDETHPAWPATHYGAHKAAIEAFVHSYGAGQNFPICALRPTGIYGLARPAQESKWFELVRNVVQGKKVTCRRGGKEVHAADVAAAIGLLVQADATTITGQAFNCYDRYISEYEVAQLAREISGSAADIAGEITHPKHQIVTERIRSLGMQFGGTDRLRHTVAQLVAAAQEAN
jgi:nucleoside-diphosphate-sugar epimerase